MKKSKKAYDIKELYDDIYKCCVLSFMDIKDKKSISIYEKILGCCDKLLDGFKNSMLNSTKSFDDNFIDFERSASIVQDYDDYLNEKISLKERKYLDQIIQKAYSDGYVYKGEDSIDYFIEDRTATLRPWKTGENPYADLQEVSRLYEKKIKYNSDDVMSFMSDVLEILKQKLSAEDTELYFVKICEKYQIVYSLD